MSTIERLTIQRHEAKPGYGYYTVFEFQACPNCSELIDCSNPALAFKYRLPSYCPRCKHSLKNALAECADADLIDVMRAYPDARRATFYNSRNEPLDRAEILAQLALDNSLFGEDKVFIYTRTITVKRFISLELSSVDAFIMIGRSNTGKIARYLRMGLSFYELTQADARRLYNKVKR